MVEFQKIKIMLEVRNLKIYQGRGRERRLVSGPLSFKLPKGEMVALLGANGIGKTTLLRTLAGLHDDFEGEIDFNQKPLGELPLSTRAKKIAVVLTEKYLGEGLRLRQLVSLGRIPHTGWLGGLQTHDESVVDRALSLTEMERFQTRFLREMSDGERQKGMIARALAQEPELIFLDEPTAFLDLTNRSGLTRLLRELTQKLSMLTVFSTHDLDLAIRYADRFLVMSECGLECETVEAFLKSGQLEKLFPMETLPPLEWMLSTRKGLS